MSEEDKKYHICMSHSDWDLPVWLVANTKEHAYKMIHNSLQEYPDECIDPIDIHIIYGEHIHASINRKNVMVINLADDKYLAGID